MYLVINKCVTAVKVSNFSPEVLSIPPGTSCITLIFTHLMVTR